MTVLFIPVGIPGCGKSTWIKGFPDSIACVSTDNVRKSMNRSAASVDKDIFETYYKWLEVALDSYTGVYADATNLRDFARADLRKMAQRHGAATHLVLFRNVEQAISRNSLRHGTVPGYTAVPPEAMFKLIEQYERAIFDIENEHYDFITEVSSIG